MLHLESLFCYACQTSRTRNLFDDKERKAIFGSCGHSICLTCSRESENKSCPICKCPEAFKNGIVNYEAMNLIEHYKMNAFDIFRKWWKTLQTGIGVCSSCSSQEILRICKTCQQAQNLKDVNLDAFFQCPKCSDRMIERTRSGAVTHQCDRISVKDRMRGSETVKCVDCGHQTDDPQICSICFSYSTKNINVDTFSICADCVIENHRDHKTSKAAEDYSIRHSTVEIVTKLLMIKLDGIMKEGDEMKCKLREMRLNLTGRAAIYWASSHYPLYTEEDCSDPKLIGRPKIHEGQVEKVLSNTERQYDQLQNLRSTCHCVGVWKEIVRLNIFDCHGLPPHFLAMATKPNEVLEVDGCPYDFETSQKWRQELLEIIEKGEKLTKPHEKIFVYPGE